MKTLSSSRFHLCLGIHVAHVLNVPCRDFLDTGFREWPGVGRVPTRHAKCVRHAFPLGDFQP
jgi:hypothetical protein